MIGDRIQNCFIIDAVFLPGKKAAYLSMEKERIFLFCGIYGNSIFFTDADSLLIGVILGTVMEKSGDLGLVYICLLYTSDAADEL